MAITSEALFSITTVSGKSIRLPLKQWIHIVESHDYMAGNVELVLQTLSEPDFVLLGINGETLTIKGLLQDFNIEKVMRSCI